MVNYSPDVIGNAQSLLNDISQWISEVDIYISPIRGDYTQRRQNESVIIQGQGIGQTCQIAQLTDILGNSGLFNMSFDVTNELDAIASILNTTMTPAQVSRVNNAFSSFASWARSVVGYISKPIPNINIETGGLAYGTQVNINDLDNPILSVCGINVSPAIIDLGNQLINRSQSVLTEVRENQLPEPVDTVMAPITVPENGAGRLFDLMDRLYSKINNEHYIIITRVNQIKSITSDLAEFIEVNLSATRAVQTNVFATRTELKEARQGIKDLLGLGDKFYEGSVSTIELLERINEVHQSENDVLYEIRVRSEEIKSFVEEIRADTLDIDEKLEALRIQIQENFTQTNQYIQTVIETSETNILNRIEQMRQEQYQQTLAIIETINRIDTSVG